MKYWSNLSQLSYNNAPINFKPAGEGGGRRGIGRGFDCSLWPDGRAFELSCCPEGRDIWIFFMLVTTNHFPGWGISIIFDLTFLPGVGNFTAIFWTKSSPRPMPCPHPPPPLLPCRLDIDRCITSIPISNQAILISKSDRPTCPIHAQPWSHLVHGAKTTSTDCTPVHWILVRSTCTVLSEPHTG